VYNPFAYTEFGKRMSDNPDPMQVSFDPTTFSTSPVKNYFTDGMDFSSETPLTNEGAQNRNQQGKSDMNALMEAHKAVQSLYEPMGGTAIGGSENIRVKTDVYGRPYTTVRMTPTDEMGRSQKQETLSFGISDEMKKAAAVSGTTAPPSAASTTPSTASTQQPSSSQGLQGESDIDKSRRAYNMHLQAVEQSKSPLNRAYYESAAKYGYGKTASAPTTLDAASSLKKKDNKLV